MSGKKFKQVLEILRHFLTKNIHHLKKSPFNSKIFDNKELVFLVYIARVFLKLGTFAAECLICF
jgi:uncharacterized protein YeeX (DUF496 family)